MFNKSPKIPVNSENFIWLTGIFIVSCLFLLLPINKPLVGHFASYQANYAMITQFMIRDGIWGIILPQANCIFDGKPGIILLSYPLCSLVTAFLGKLTGGDIVFLGRLQSVLFTFGCFRVFFLIVKKYSSGKQAIFAFLCFALSPLVLISGHGFQNEAVALFFLLLSFYFMTGLEKDSGIARFLLSAVCFSIALLVRLHFLFALPAILCLLWSRFAKRLGYFLPLYVFLAVLPTVLWFLFTYHILNTHTNVWTSLFIQSQADKVFPHPLLLDVEFYKRLFYCVVEVGFTPVFFPFLLLGLGLKIRSKEELFWYLWLIMGIAGFFLIPQKFYDHNFYIIYMIPPGAFFVGRGLSYVFESGSYWSHTWSAWLVGLFFTFTFLAVVFRFYYGPAFSRLPEERQMNDVIRYVKSHTEPSDRIAVVHGGNAVPLFYFDRLGWAFDIKDTQAVPLYWRINKYNPMPPEKLEKMKLAVQSGITWLEFLREEGADYLVITDRSLANQNSKTWMYIQNNFPMISNQSEHYFVFDLRKPSKREAA